MAEITINASKRENNTKGDLNQLRRNSIVPGVYYNKGDEPISVAIDEKSVNKLVFTQETNIISLKIDDNEPIQCIVKDVQFDPLTDKVIHFDLIGVTLGQQLELQIPIQFVGQPIGVQTGGVLQQFMHKLDVECLPRHIPENVEIDISSLEVGDAIHIKDLSFENLRILNPEEVLVVSVSKSRAVEEEKVEEAEEELEPESAEPEVIGKGKSEEE